MVYYQDTALSIPPVGVKGLDFGDINVDNLYSSVLQGTVSH